MYSIILNTLCCDSVIKSTHKVTSVGQALSLELLYLFNSLVYLNYIYFTLSKLQVPQTLTRLLHVCVVVRVSHVHGLLEQNS